ncbi:hypothetical protein Ctha_0123 [Chloroherpeton thalassium ATCC 35110]|uniref:Uncharacterized protein n=1 Tax=Chloroherpeton thalassium (strain ATCC 35110 / GB-78) TaxID=517418 RepID=B3QSV1_CHLT3|nr:hypothetical protein Ctha_0123 [Chloroherpeton thalassium ATCC 35110]
MEKDKPLNDKFTVSAQAETKGGLSRSRISSPLNPTRKNLSAGAKTEVIIKIVVFAQTDRVKTTLQQKQQRDR